MATGIFFSIQVKTTKNGSKHVRTCKLSSDISLRYDCSAARFTILIGGVLLCAWICQSNLYGLNIVTAVALFASGINHIHMLNSQLVSHILTFKCFFICWRSVTR